MNSRRSNTNRVRPSRRSILIAALASLSIQAPHADAIAQTQGGEYAIAVVDAAGRLDATYTYNSIGARITVSRGGGAYRLRLHGFAEGPVPPLPHQGNVQISALGEDNARCHWLFHEITGPDLDVVVWCRDPAGTITPSGFVFFHERPTAGSTRMGGLALPARKTLPFGNVERDRSYNSSGGVNWVERESEGRYHVGFPGLGRIGGNAQATIIGTHSRGHCEVDPGGNHCGPDQVVPVSCFDESGRPHDESFFLNFLGRGSFHVNGHGAYTWVISDGPETHEAGAAYTGNSACGAANAVRRVGTGEYVVSHVGQDAVRGIPLVTATLRDFDGDGADDARYCKIVAWRGGSAGVDVEVRCFDSAGSRADSDFSEIFITADDPPASCP